MAIIRVIDLETTGFEPPAEVVEIACVDVMNGVVQPAAFQELVKPSHPIPPECSAIHHILDEDVVDARSWEEVRQTIVDAGIEVSFYAAHNAKFERQFITDETTGGRPWICTYKCALRLWPNAPTHSNFGLFYWRRPDGANRDMAKLSHRALPDAYVTAFHLRDMLALAPITDLLQWSLEPALQIRCHIGKNRGKLWEEVDSGFLNWLLDKDFDEDVKFTAQYHLDKRKDNHREAS